MNMPLAACLPDFGSGDTPNAIEDHTPAAAAATGVAGAPRPQANTARAGAAKVSPARVKDGRPRSAGDALQSVVRHIKLVEEPEFVSPIVEPKPPVDIDALLKEHADRVRAEEAEKAKAALAAALAQERRAHEEQRRKERAEWVEAQSAPLAASIVTALAGVEENLSQSLARMFAPFLKDAVRDKALGELRDTVCALLGEEDAPRIEVSGPGDLIDRIRDAIAGSAPERAGQIVYTVTGAADVRVVAGNTVSATQLGTWNQRIEAALGLH